MSALDLRLNLEAAAMRIRIAGNLDSANAHLLSKVVIGCLRRYAIPTMEVDLTEVVEMDHVGVMSILDCQRCAQRHGVLFALTGLPSRMHRILNDMGAGDLLPVPAQHRPPQTGTICRSRRSL